MVENGYVVYGRRSFVNLIYESAELAIPQGDIPSCKCQLATWSKFSLPVRALMFIQIEALLAHSDPICYWMCLSSDVIYIQFNWSFHKQQ